MYHWRRDSECPWRVALRQWVSQTAALLGEGLLPQGKMRRLLYRGGRPLWNISDHPVLSQSASHLSFYSVLDHNYIPLITRVDSLLVLQVFTGGLYTFLRSERSKTETDRIKSRELPNGGTANKTARIAGLTPRWRYSTCFCRWRAWLPRLILETIITLIHPSAGTIVLLRQAPLSFSRESVPCVGIL